jgi:hypothetical protein
MDKQCYMEQFLDLSPEFQPDGQRTIDKARDLLDKTFRDGKCVFEWMNKKTDGTLIPMEVTLTRVEYGDDYAAVGYGRDLRQHKQMMEDIEYRDNMLKAVNQAAALLLTADTHTDIESPIITSMEIIGRSVSVNRVHIWRNVMTDGKLYHVCEYTWCDETGKQKVSVPVGLRITHDQDRPEWISKLRHDECIFGPISRMSQNDQAFLSNYDIKSVLIIPLFIGDQFWGLFCLDDCTRDRTTILRSVSLMMANAIKRHSLIASMNEERERLMLMLDSSPLCAQIWDRNLNTIDCNMASVRLYGFKDKQEYTPAGRPAFG